MLYNIRKVKKEKGMNKKWQIYEADTEETNRIAEKYKNIKEGKIKCE